jgi:hypothetical protein
VSGGGEHADVDAISREVLKRQETFERTDATAGYHDMRGHCHILALATGPTSAVTHIREGGNPQMSPGVLRPWAGLLRRSVTVT